jgi:predicted ABC-type sugar transport system permease subunit
MEHHQYAHDMQETMAREIEHKRPKFIVFVNVPTSWSIRDGSDRFIFNWAAAFLSRSYKLDGVADIVAGGSQYVWGAPALAYDLRSAFFIRIYRRVD